MVTNRIQDVFPDRQLPPMLAKTVQFCNGLSGSYSAEFQFTDRGKALMNGLPNPACFAPFGVDGSGGFWTYWSPPPIRLSSDIINTMPVVFISGEAISSAVVAPTFEDFLSLLAIGCEELGDKAADDRPIAYSNEYCDSNLMNSAFREWLASELHILPAGAPNEIVMRGKLAYGKQFVDWFVTWQGMPPWSKLPRFGE